MSNETDRELMELAAKATGLMIISHESDGSVVVRGDELRWAPLTDDGDALRLAVKLGILGFAADEADLSENQIGDEYANTRRAIVRAAAEIGRVK